MTEDELRLGPSAPSLPGADAIRGHLRLAGHRRVSHGLFLPHAEGLSARAEFLRDLGAVRQVLPDSAVFTHVTAARVLDWQLPALPEQVPIFAAVEGDSTRPQRPGLIFSRLVRTSRPGSVHGLPIDLPEEIMLRAARELGLLDLLILLDSGRKKGHINATRMRVVLGSRRPGVRMLGKAWSLSDPRSDSGPETLLRAFHLVLEIPVVPQAILRDDQGRVIGRADLLIQGTKDLSEYDGDVHRPKVQHKIDLRRDRALLGADYARRGYTLDDLLNYPMAAMQELDRLLRRPTKVRRLREWQRLVENSLYGTRGRERVLNRWRRIDGIVDWSETA